MKKMDRFNKGGYCKRCGKYISNLRKHLQRDRCDYDLQHKRKVK